MFNDRFGFRILVLIGKLLLGNELKKTRRALTAAEGRRQFAVYEASKSGASGEDVDRLMEEYSVETEELKEDYSYARTQQLLREARNLELPLPDSEFWESGRSERSNILTEEGAAELRAQIRIERRERREVWFRWGTFVVGLLGAFTGLLAVVLTLTRD
jgi:hypothetical protein